MKNKIFIVAGIIGLLLVAVVGLSFYYGKRQDDKITNSIIAQEKELAEKEKKAVADYETTRLAYAANKLDGCYKLEGRAKDDCIYGIANITAKEEYCDQIEKIEAKKICHDSFAFKKAIRQGDSQQCLTLENGSFKSQCLDHFYFTLNKASECEKFSSENKTKCLDLVNNNIAFDNNNISGCDAINNQALRADCQQNIDNKPKDTDGDGITDSLENSYGTNAFKADTDGDGLSDLDEISKYFTDPKNPDTDNDGISDGEAVRRGLIKAKD